MTGTVRQEKGIIAILLLSIALAYGNTYAVPFIFDDTFNILENSSIRHLWPPWHSFTIPEDTGLAGRPVVNFSLAVNYAISGTAVWSYHLVNLLIHLLATVTFFGIVRFTTESIGDKDGQRDGLPWVAAGCALIWGLHPLQTQAVTYVIQRCESLMALFLMLTLYASLVGWRPKASNRWHLLAVLFFLLAVGSKESAVMAPFILLAYEWVFRKNDPVEAVRESPVLYAGLTFGTLLAIAISLTGNTWVTRTESTPISAVTYWITQCQVILHYLYMAIWPANLVIDYGWPAATIGEAWLDVAAILTLIGLFAWALCKRQAIGFLGACFFLFLAPTSLIPLPDSAFEHRMYLPLAALILLAAATASLGYEYVKVSNLKVISTRESRRKIAVTVVVSLALTLGVLTFQRNHDYRSEMAIWRDTIQKRPSNFRGYHGVGLALSREGRFAEALGYFHYAIRLNPTNAYVQNDTGYLLFLMNRPGESIPFFREAIRLKPLNPKAYNNLGAALAQTSRLEEAILQFSMSLKLKPDNNPARNNKFQAEAELRKKI